jgi:hypothetical protein
VNYCAREGDGLPAQDEEEEESDDYDAEDEPAYPVVPGTSVAAVAPAVVCVASSHYVLD